MHKNRVNRADINLKSMGPRTNPLGHKIAYWVTKQLHNYSVSNTKTNLWIENEFQLFIIRNLKNDASI